MSRLSGAKTLVVICTRNRAASAPFYRDVLGLELQSEDAFAAIFAISGGELRLSTVEDWTAHAHTVFGFGVDDVEGVVASLSARGVSFNRYPGFDQSADGLWTAPDGSARVAWFNDPDGNVLSLTEFAK